MGTRGPKKKSREDQEARGNPGKRKLADAPPEQFIDPSMPTPPNYLGPDALRVWSEIVPDLVDMGRVVRLDSRRLASLCSLFALVEKCERKLEQDGYTVRNSNRTDSARPEVKLRADALKQLDALCEKYGLSSKSRDAMNIKTRAPKPQSTNGSTSTKASSKADKYGFNR